MKGILQEVVKSKKTVSFNIIDKNNTTANKPQLYTIEIVGLGLCLCRKLFDSELITDFKNSNLLVSKSATFVIIRHFWKKSANV